MPFLYEFRIDNTKVEVQIGFSTSTKWEEALDESSFIIPFTYENDIPYKMFSMVDIEITEIDNYTDQNIVGTKVYEYIIFSDEPTSVGSYGYYQHQVNAIEYSAKLDFYMINNLSKSRSILKNTQAPFTTAGITSSSETEWYPFATLENLNLKEDFYANQDLVFNQVYQAYIFSLDPLGYRRTDAVIKTNATLVSGTSPHTLSDGPATWVFPEGEWEIEYGFIADGTEGASYTVGFNMIYTFYVEALGENELSMYDVIEEIRSSVSKFGGIEDTIYYDVTRIFDIDAEYVDYLKNTQAPQIYLSQATARQTIIYILSFVNALPRLIYGEDLDTLTLETYNLSTGTFTQEDVIAYGSKQNTNQIGTRNYQPISQALANNLDDTSIHSPSRSGYQQVRALDIQLTADNFTIKLPEKSPLYMPKKLVVIIPEIDITATGGIDPILTITDLELDITPRWINDEEWKYKDITTDFPDITSRNIWDTNLGRRSYKVENLTWKVGDTHINLSTVFGTLFKGNLIHNVVKMAIYEYIMLNPPIPLKLNGNFSGGLGVSVTIPSITEYKDWRFRVEYITDERLVLKQEKEDLDQIDFYSEMKINQEESLVNIVRQSRKGYGDLQRTGNVSFTFPKKHTSLADFHSVGQKDVNNLTITQIDTRWFNEHAIANYSVTKYHNRIQQATMVNQKYRPFDNFAKSVLNRHEHYGDYLIALPPDDTTSGVTVQDTKIYSNDKTVRMITKILLGNEFGLPTKPSATVALVRTDGMFKVNPEASPSNTRYFIVSPLTSRGVKGGFAFTLGFQSNQSAGDGIVSELVDGVTTYFNQAVKYTDKKGRFTRFGFAIMKDLEFDSGDYPTYPLIENTITAFDTYFESNTYFWCGDYNSDNKAFDYPLVWNKDPMTNAQLTYQLNVVSYYVGLYVFGLKFFTENYIVREHEILNGAKLYVYTDGTVHEMFEDLFVKSGYDSSVTLRDNEVSADGNIEYDSTNNTVLFVGISMVGITSWAIGIPNDDGVIELLLACNEGLSGVKFVNTHFRPNIKEIGKRGIQFYIAYASAVDLSDFSGTAILNYTLQYIIASAPILSGFNGIANLEYTDRIYSAEAYSIVLNDFNGTADLIYTDRTYNIEAHSDELSSFNGIATLVYTDRVYPVEAYSISLSSFSGTGVLEYTGKTYSAEAYSSALSSFSGVANATYDPTVYWTVRYLDWNGTVLSTQQVLDGGNAIEYDDDLLDRTGYIFNDWDRSRFNITANTDITAEYTIITYTVYFVSNGSIYDTQYVDYLEDATTPTPNPTKATDDTYDYTFDSWDTAYTNVTGDMTTTAVFNATVRTDVSWVEVSSGTVTTDSCVNIYDVGNIKEDASCVFAGGAAYQSQTNETTTIPPCSDGATYTLCVKISTVPLLFSCVDYEGEEGAPVKYECQID